MIRKIDIGAVLCIIVISFVAALLQPAKAKANYQYPVIISQTQNVNDSVQAQLRGLMSAHATIGGLAFVAHYDGSANESQLVTQVNANTDQIARTVGVLYAFDRQDEFRDLWNQHITLLNQYTDASKNYETAQQNQVRQQLQDIGNRLANYFASFGNNVPQDQLQQMFQMHIQDEEAIIDAHANQNDTQAAQLMEQASIHATMMADQLLQQSSKYKNNQLGQNVCLLPTTTP